MVYVLAVLTFGAFTAFFGYVTRRLLGAESKSTLVDLIWNITVGAILFLLYIVRVFR
jgi:hypothetical protein